MMDINEIRLLEENRLSLIKRRQKQNMQIVTLAPLNMSGGLHVKSR